MSLRYLFLSPENVIVFFFFALLTETAGYNCMVLLTCLAARTPQRVPGASWPSGGL